MSPTDESPAPESLLPWGFINLNQYRVPSEPTHEAMRAGILGFWDRLKQARSSPETPTIEIDLEAMPGDLLAQAAPAPDWSEGVPALHQALQDWWQERSGRIQVLVGAPHSGTAEMASHWAAAFQARILPDPSLEQIKSGGREWLEQLDQSPDQVWVIPRLERLYLRHSQGFGLLRALIDKIGFLPGRVLVVCDSWAWAYLGKVLHLEALWPQPLVLKAFDQVRLDRWFRGLAAGTPGKGFIFRQADSEKLVVRLDEMAREKLGEQGVTDFLQRLAAFSRGIPGVAYTVWRYSLGLARDKDEEEAEDEKPKIDDGLHKTIRVEPWSHLELPSLPNLDPRGREIFVLHTLLLHDGLPGELLVQILPFPESQTQDSLHLLRRAGVLGRDQDRWRVTAWGYPAVRKYLANEGYLVDAL